MTSAEHKHLSYESLEYFLEHKKDFKHQKSIHFKKTIDYCKVCWEIWNKVRWDAALSSKGVDELRRYLGDAFVPYFDSSWALAKEWCAKNPQSPEEIAAFYRETPNYIYNSLIFYESKDREDLTQEMQLIFRSYNIASVLDYGCGSGNDGLAMLEQGAKVYFIDYNLPSLDFLRWRLQDRKYSEKKDYEIIPVHQGISYPSADLFWCVDVLEHMANPFTVLDIINEQTRVFAFFTDADDKANGRHPFHFAYNLANLTNGLQKLGFSHTNEGLLQIWVRQ
jgi:SAM-dependent methyltransferase